MTTMRADVLPLSGASVAVPGSDSTADLIRHLLTGLGATIGESGSAAIAFGSDLPPATELEEWADSGAMALTGRADGPPRAAPGASAGAVRAALAVFGALSRARGAAVPSLPGIELLGERAALAGLTRRGPWSAGGAYRALPTRDGFLGISLPRSDDLDSIPALVQDADCGDPWTAVARWAGTQSTVAAADRARLLGLAAAAVPEQPGALDGERSGGSGIIARPGGVRRHRRSRPLVVDLTSLWAGPLCAHLLGLAGAEVVKVESTRRPDGARVGSRPFYDLLHGGHASVAVDLTTPDGVGVLRQLIAAADVVLEASRPRALRRLGIDAEAVVAQGITWVGITAYGRTGPGADRIGFGDDVAAAAGLVVRDGAEVLPCGDALADPVTGVHAAAATAAALLSDRAFLIDVSMRDVVAAAARYPVFEPHEVLAGPNDTWLVRTSDREFPVRLPRARQPARRAADLGADNATVFDRWCGL